MNTLGLLQRGWKDQLAALLGDARERVLVSSPFVTEAGTNFLNEHLSPAVRDEGEMRVLTNLSPSNVVQDATSPAALKTLLPAAQTTTFYHLPQLHAKVYVADEEAAIVTSANLTAGGLDRNYEYGLRVDERDAVRRIRRDVEEYAELGALIGADRLAAYRRAAENVRATFQEQQRTASRSAQQQFAEALQEAEDELLRARLAQGPVTRVFEKTVLYLLRREGPMRTPEIHPRVQAIHPDLCDDNVDRVIEGERFGKKWKHWVRTAQQHLKGRGQIERLGKKWQIRDESPSENG